MNDERSGSTRCFRGHTTPAGKTFCETCGATLEVSGPPPRPTAGDGDADVVPTVSRRRLRPRRRSEA
jgi:hypothetical protein